ncbi:MAG: very short patch repair endonuclease [Hyphomicrobium sp.]
MRRTSVIDRVSPQQRSELMARVRGRDTMPERIVRSAAHRMGYRFRLHVGGLPGCPDLVFPSKHKIIFVHGCFWHRHACKRGSLPASNIEFWREKLERNRNRDREALQALRRSGWRVLVVWECETRDSGRLNRRLSAFLSDVKET